MENKNMKMGQQRQIGGVARIDLGDGAHTYARVLSEASFAFYDGRSIEEIPIDRVITLPVLFIVAVMDTAITRGRWPIIGSVPLEKHLLELPPMFMQDIKDKERFNIYEQGGKIRPATRNECVGLERAAVWEPAHVEDRLRDHYAGRKSSWVESLKIRD